MATDYLKFHDDSETNEASFQNRINQLYNYRKNIAKLISKDSFQPTGDYTKFLRLKAIDAMKEDVQESNIASSVKSPVVASTLSDPEAEAIQEAVESMQASEFVQLFLDTYMSPIGSDIDYRLGKVVGIKSYLYNDGGYTYPESVTFGQYDKYGRIDTTLNLRLTVEIPSIGTRSQDGWWDNAWGTKNVSVVPATTEQYANLFFPPFTLNSFSDATSLSTNADKYITTRKWNNITKKWKYEDDFDPDQVTYDTGKLLSMRKNPTYRLPAYKAINDNIMFLQHIFEESCGVVSTYLTEWDLSLYIQEGLLSGKENKAPSYLTLTNRILKDNPSGYTDTRGFVYGALNACVSKTPIDVPPPNLSEWIPSAYPLSVYWLPYESNDRGDGLDMFFDCALDGFDGNRLKRYPRGDGNKFSANTYEKLTFKEKLMRDDQIGAAFSGWENWQHLYYWQALYTGSDDGLSEIDIVHMGIDESSSTFENTKDDEGNDIDGVIQQVIDAIYNDSHEHEYAETVLYSSDSAGHQIRKKYEYDAYTGKMSPNGSEVDYDDGTKYYNNQGVEISGGDDDGDLSVKGVKIPGSRILKGFLKHSSKQSNAMNMANKEKTKNYSTAASSSNTNIFADSTSGSTTNSNNSGNSGSSSGSSGSSSSSSSSTTSTVSGSSIVSMVDANAAESGQYARPDGVSQWSPVLYGGPHGRSYSPKTVEGYFEESNEFLRNVPRLNADGLSTNAKLNFQETESRYCPGEYNTPAGQAGWGWGSSSTYNFYPPYRSPSRCRNLLVDGHCDYTLQRIWCLRPRWFWSEKPYGYINWNWYWTVGYGWSWDEFGTGFLTPVSFMCNPWAGDYYPNCPHYYWSSWFEWSAYNRYAGYYGGWWWWQSAGDYYLSYHKDYWGRLGYLCIWSCENIGNYWSTWWWHRHQHYHGVCGVYHMKCVRQRLLYYCRYNQWEAYNYKRPLMHSNPNATNASYWSLNAGYRHYNVYCKWYYNHWWWNYWAHFMNGISSHRSSISSREIAMYYKPQCEGYRLTFPQSGVSYHRCTAWGWCDIRNREEEKFLEYVTGNSWNGWHDVYLFQSSQGTTMSDRRDNGPVSIFRVPVRRNHYAAPFWQWVLMREPHCHCGFHWDWCWHLVVVYGWVPYIEVDMNNVKEIWTGIKSAGKDGVAAWSNLDATLRAGSNQEAIIDVPPGNTAMTDLPDSPFGYSGLVSWGMGDTQIWAGMNRDGNEFSMHGWGYSTTMPGMEYYMPDPNGVFEDPNKYLNLQNVLGSECKTWRISELCKKLPFWTLDNTAPLRYILPEEAAGHNTLQLQGVKQYTQVPYLDNGLIKVFQNLYCTSTFFKYKEGDIGNFLRPRLVYNDNGYRTLARIVNHQKVWLEQAKKIFVENIDFQEIRLLIQNTTNTTILSKSLPTSTSRDTSSVFYHYWIEKAYELFKDDSQKPNILAAFDRRITAMDTFLKVAEEYIGKTSYEWSYDDYTTVYNSIKELKAATVSYVDPTTRERDYTIEEFMYSYLYVLYEYRKFYINKRCNKVDGTLNTMRALEGAIPMVTESIKGFNPAGEGRTNTIFDSNSHQYKVSYYDIDNSNISKIKSMIEPDTKLNEDRTMLLYIKVKYASDMSVVNDYLEKCKNGTVNANDQRYIWIPKKQKYAELPFDDYYRYESKEYNLNEAAKKFNSKATAFEKRELNPNMDDCVFKIKWSDWGTMDKIQEASGASAKNKLRSKLGYENDYPYVYYEAPDWKSRLNIQKNGAKIPKIKYDIQSGIDPTKLIEAQSAIQGANSSAITASDIMCTVGSKSDFWVVAIPRENRPRAQGYVSNLKIKTYKGTETSPKPNAATVASAGAFGYALYPITEEQANSIPGIGLDMSGIQAQMQSAYLDDYESLISNMNTTE